VIRRLTSLPWRRALKRAFVGGGFLSLGSAIMLAAWVLVPPPAGLLAPPSGSGMRIVDRHGVLLRATRSMDGTRARWVPLAGMDPDLLVAFVSVEDRRFWDHPGVDPLAVMRAVRDDLRARRIVSGASTITMQLARLLRPNGRGWRSKAGEAAWALRLDWHLSKQEILEQYLNRVHLGQGTVGVGAAASLYLGAAADELSVGEAALLAGLAHAPSRDNPVPSPRRATSRRDLALRRMLSTGAIHVDAADRARREPPLSRRTAEPFLAPHFTTRVINGAQVGERDDVVVRTTLDAALQREVEGEVRHAVSLLRDRGVRQAAAVVLDNRSGDVLAWVGSADFWDLRDGQTDMVMSRRQPGSALKPFLYALAFDRGSTAATVLPDIPKSYATLSGPYEPRNYDRRFRGPVRAREALASSYNVPAVELASRIGTQPFLRTLQLAGFASLARSADHYGLGLALGNGDVSLMELANGYRALANGGTWRAWRWRVDEPRAGPASGRRVVSPQAAALTLDILADPVARAPGFGIRTPFEFPFPVAVKTGTSRHFTDNWAVGTTASFTVAVWAGDFSGRPMEGVSGVTGAGPLLHRVVMLTAARYTPGALRSPADAGLRAVGICRVSGMLATRECPATPEWFIAGTAPTSRDTWVRDGRARLPAEFAGWVAQAGRAYDLEAAEVEVDPDAPLPPEVEVPREGPLPPAGFRITSPADGDVYRLPPGVPLEYATVAFRASGESGPVSWFVNGSPYTASRWALRAGTHVIRAVARSGTTSEITIRVSSP
jgi:penicillin-binding protein 1C